jgi:hypothetical protein
LAEIGDEYDEELANGKKVVTDNAKLETKSSEDD